MNTVKVYQLKRVSQTLFRRLKAAHMEAALVWNTCCDLHKEARTTHAKWPGRTELQTATKGKYALHSQSVQMVVHAFLANVQTTRQLKPANPQMHYPYKVKQFYPVHWPEQAVSKEKGRVVLPMGRGRASLVLPLDLPENSGACTLVWNSGFELHVCVAVPQAEHAPGLSQGVVFVRSKDNAISNLANWLRNNPDVKSTRSDGRSCNAPRTKRAEEVSAVFGI